MPIYGFECTTCGHRFDKLQRLSDADPETCPSCGVATVKRQLTAPSFRLAGGGWYETDFKKDGDKKRNLAEGGSGTASATGSGDAKPAASESKPAASSAGGATGGTSSSGGAAS